MSGTVPVAIALGHDADAAATHGRRRWPGVLRIRPETAATRTVRVALLGCGTVGRGFVELVTREHDRIARRYGVDLRVDRILIRDGKKERPGIDGALLTTEPLDVLDGGCDVVVELVGGVHSAGTFVRRAIRNRCHVVTANKALLSASGRELFGAARAAGVTIGFEASVCGAVPVIGALRRGLAGDSVESIIGILNGTSNFILSRMHEGLAFADALACAQELGFAEADPSLDVSGEDAAQKLAILAGLAFELPVRRRSVTGIGGITAEDVQRARSQRKTIRQIAEAVRVPGGVVLTVEPRLFEDDHPLARVNDETNAVVIRGRATGELWFSGKGAGSLPTAAAVLSDVLSISRNRMLDLT